MTIQHVRVAGTSYQRGLQYGQQAADRVRWSVRAYQRTFEHFAGWDWATALLHTNHFQHPRIHPADLSLWAMPSSQVRLQRLQAAQQSSNPRTLDDFQAILADHADYPYSVCAHPEPAAHPFEQGQTIASVLMDLTAGQLWLAAGNPCQVPYEQLTVKL